MGTNGVKMKNLVLVTIVSIIFSVSVFSQINNLAASPDSTLKIDCAYAGFLSWTNFNYNKVSVETSSATTFTGGFMASYVPTSDVTVHAAIIFLTDNRSNNADYHRFWLTAKQGNFILDAGIKPALSTESRPSPLSGAGQFEDWTQRQIPGGALGVSLKYALNGSSNYFGVGLSQRNGANEYQVRFASSHVALTGWYPQFNKKFGAALDLSWDGFRNVTEINAGQTLGNFTNVTLSQKQDISVYLDAGHSYVSNSTVRLETGILKGFTAGSFLKGLVGVAYNYENHAMVGYIFVHI